MNRWIPETCTEKIEGPGAVVYSSPDGLHAIAYVGKSTKRKWFYKFRSRENRDAEIKKLFDAVAYHAKNMAERKAARQIVSTELQPGDIIYNSWGYDQTNIDFYQVVSVSASRKTVEIVEIPGRITTDATLHAMSGSIVACPVDNPDKSTARKVRATGKDSVSMKHGWAGKWDGRPLSCSWYA